MRAREGSRLILFGGASLDGEPRVWRNFVASSGDRIEQAKADWRAQVVGKVPGDEDEFIPFPD